MDRIAFIKLGMTLAATEVWLSGCADDGDGGSASGGAAAGAPAGPTAGNGTVAGNASGSGAGNGGGGIATGSGGSGTPAGECTTDANLVQTSMESHDHLPLTTPITAAQLNAGSPTEYAVALDQNHIHTLTFTQSDFEMLRAGMLISKRSSSMMGHTHTYQIKCV